MKVKPSVKPICEDVYKRQVAHSLGLNRPGEVTEQPDNAATQGKIAKIAHLVVVTKA